MAGEGRYRLAALLRLGIERERCAAAALAVALADLGNEETELSGCDARLGDRGREAAGAGREPAGRNGQALQWRARRLRRLREEMRELADRRDAARVRVQEAREAADRASAALAAAMAGRREIELHRERWAEERRAARQAALEAEHDDLARAGPAHRHDSA